MKKSKTAIYAFLFTIVLILLNACGTGSEVSDTNTINQPEYFTEKLTMYNYMHYLSVDCKYEYHDDGYIGGVSYYDQVWYNIDIVPYENGLIFEDCTITIAGSTKEINPNGKTYISFVQYHKKADGTVEEFSKVSAIVGTVKIKNDNVYRVYYHDRNGEMIGSDRVTIGKSISENPMPDQLDGYSFLGWSTSKLERDIVDFPYTPAKNTTLQAIYKGNNITVTLYDDGNMSNVNVEYGTIINLPVPKKENYEFAGWYDAPSGKSIKYTNSYGTGVSQWQSLSPKTLYARWFVKKADKEWDDQYYYSLEYYNIKNARVSYYKENYFFVDAEPYVTYRIITSTQYMKMNSNVSIRIAGAMGALLEGGQFINYSFGTDRLSCPTFEFQVSQAGRYFITVIGYGLQSTPNLDYLYNISCEISY